MAKTLKTLTYLGDYIDGRFMIPDRYDGEIKHLSPADLTDHIMQLRFRYDHVAMATTAARHAFESWSELTFEQRKSYLMRLKEIYSSHKDEMAEVISRETGKPTWEANTEVQAMINKIDITVSTSIHLLDEVKVENALPKVDGYIRHKARGVMAVLGPFNFPGHLPNGHIIPALATGNTVIFKPSEKTPAIAQLMAQLFEKAEFPRGVFNVVQGDGEVGKRLAVHEHVDGVLFTGSYEVGLKIKQDTMNHFWKILALEMGGKNAAIVWGDADLDKAIYECITGAYLTAGQRCSCTSRLILHRQIADQFLKRFYETAKKLTIGYWQDSPFMGPLISADAVEKYIRFQEIAKREGCESMMRGKALETNHDGYYVTPSISLVNKADANSVYQKSEIFGPNVAVYVVDDFEEALHINNATGFGLVTSVFTKDRSRYELALKKARVGMVNWNRATNGASSRMPFGGLGKSGNDRPTAHFAVYYSTVPVACLEDMTPLDRSSILPGVTYEF